VTRRLAAGLAGVLAGVLLATGCSGGSAPAGDGGAGGSTSASTVPPSTSSPDGGTSRFHRYVAMGDSFSAGPLIPTTDLAGGCLRSDHNYPSLVARRLHVRTFVDVTCSGAKTEDLRLPQAGYGDARIPPQDAALTRRTDLVTLGIGGNDLDLFTTLIGTCTQLRSEDPTGSPCARRLATQGPNLEAATVTISANVSKALREIKRRAPRATVVLVGYLRLTPDHGSCPGLPLATGDYAQGRRIAESLDRALRQAARTTGVRFVDMDAASRGHDICSGDPWVNGRVTRRGVALAYHPFLAGMRADAERVVAALRR
jgi:lysophospholipase L1-like esterase